MTDSDAERRLDEITEQVALDWRSAGSALRLVLTYGAALHDATPAQSRRIIKRAQPLMTRLRETGEIAPLYRLLREVLGPTWRPTGEHAEWIKRMTESPGDEALPGTPPEAGAE